MAGASYYLGQKLYSEYDHEWKYPHSDPKRVRYTEIMLPSNAPPEYADRQTLWNAVDAAEKSNKAQTARRFTITLPRELTFEQNLALIREYCTKQFVDKGMICDLYYHDSGNGNPHVHLMLTMRAMDENGRWLPKTKTAYVLNENGQRIRGGNGKWLRERMDTVDWNDQKYAEIWRHEWEIAQNNALEAAGRTERIDMRSYERQGITDLEPQIHLGPEAAALERKGILTTRGEHNRAIKHVNALIRGLQKAIAALGEWLQGIKETLSRHETISNPDDYNLGEVLLSYLELRKADREFWNHRAQTKASLKDLQAILNAISFLKERELDTVHALGEYLSRIDTQMNDLRKKVRSKEQRIRDIDALNWAMFELFNFKEGSNVSPTYSLKTTLNIGAEYAILNRMISFGILSSTRFAGHYTYAEGMAVVNFRPLSWLHLAVNGSYSTYGAGMGALINICPNGFNLFIGCDCITPTMRYNNQMIPINPVNANVRVGIAFPFGKL